MFGDEVVPLTPKEFEVLFLLIEHAGQVVEKDKLLDTIWKDMFVEEGTLTRNVSWLRKKLAAHGVNDAKIIETVPKRGYRFLPEVTKNDEIVLTVEEQIVQEIQIEEIVEITTSPNEKIVEIVPSPNSDEKIISDFIQKALPAAPVKRRFSTLWIVPAVLLFAAAFFAYRGYSSQNAPKILAASKIAPFSGLPGRENSPAFSPDGKQLVFTWDGGIDGAKSNIYIKLISAGDPIRLTNTPHEEINPTFSPDGKTIAFVRVFPDHNEIILISALGGAERKLYETASYASISFSPDGKSIAYDAQIAGGSDVYIISADGGAPRRLTDDGKNNGLPAWSVDGKWIFFNSNRSGGSQIWKMPVSGGEAVQITKEGAFEMFAAPDGQPIIYSKGDGKTGLWSVGTNGGDEKPIPELNKAGAWRSWSVTSSGVYYTAFASQIPLHIEFYDFNSKQTGDFTRVDKLPLTYYSNLSVSDDGKKMLYARQDQTKAGIMLAKLGE